MSGADKKRSSEQFEPSQEAIGQSGGHRREKQLQQRQQQHDQMSKPVGSSEYGDGSFGGGGDGCYLDCDQNGGGDQCDTGSCYRGHGAEAEADTCAQACDLDTKNLDSGYAWLILAVMFLLQSSISGASRVYGIVYAKEVSINYYDREQASYPIATASAVENLAGILTPALASYFSWRKIEFFSASLFVLSNLLAYFSCSLTVDIVALGVIQGLALSTCTVLSLVINNDYFERYRTTAYGIQMSGSTFGVLYLSPLVSWLLTEYDNFRLVYLALAIVFCGNLILVLFIKPRARTVNSRAESAEKSDLARAVTEDELEFGKIRRVLEASLADRGAYGDGDAGNVSVGGTLRVRPVTRKRSRFELHFERKNSIASISYLARSRRDSILSKQHLTQAATTAANMNSCYCNDAKPIYTIEQAPWSALTPDKRLDQPSRQATMLTKSKSGLGLVLKASDNPIQQQQQQRWQKISLTHQVSSPFAVSNPTQEYSHATTTEPISNTNRSSMTDDCPIQFGAQRGACNCATAQLVDLECGPSRSSSLLMLAQSQQQQQSQYLANCVNSSGEIGFQEKKKVINSKPQATSGFSMDKTVQLLRLPYLHCTWIMLAIYYLIARVFVIILVDFAADHGFSLSESTNLLNYWSMGELAGRIMLAPLIDLQYLSCKSCIFATCSLLAGSILTMVMAESYIAYAICSTAIAALISLEYMLINVLMVEYVGKDQVSSCYSLAACLCSVVLFARPSMIGLFRDQLGSYDGLLILLASVAAVFALLFYALEPMLVRHWPKRQLEQ